MPYAAVPSGASYPVQAQSAFLTVRVPLIATDPRLVIHRNLSNEQLLNVPAPSGVASIDPCAFELLSWDVVGTRGLSQTSDRTGSCTFLLAAHFRVHRKTAGGRARLLRNGKTSLC